MFGEGDSYGEPEAGLVRSDDIFNRYRPAKAADDAVHDRKTKPGAFVCRALAAVEWLEDGRKIILRQAGPGIIDPKQCAAMLAQYADVDSPAFRGVSKRVVNQV